MQNNYYKAEFKLPKDLHLKISCNNKFKNQNNLRSEVTPLGWTPHLIGRYRSESGANL